MPEKGPIKAEIQDQKISGHNVRISQSGDHERLSIDGRPCRFHKTKAGYLLADGVYNEPQNTLMAAVELHLKRLTC